MGPNPAPGRFRVEEDECTSCGLCEVLAARHFALADRSAVAYRQPAGPAEVDACLTALGCCPTDAIRDQADGGTTTV